MSIHSLAKGEVAEGLVIQIEKLRLHDNNSQLRGKSLKLVHRLQSIYMALSTETESMVIARNNLPALLQELDETTHQIDMDNEKNNKADQIIPSIDTSEPNKGLHGYDRSPEMLKKGLEAQAAAHTDFMKTIYPVTQ